MKKPFYFYISVFILLLSLVITFSGTTLAQKAGSTVEEELSDLTQTLKILLIKKQPEEQKNLMVSSLPMPTEGCIDNYKSWKTSGVYEGGSEWNMMFMARKPYISNSPTNAEREQFTDLNGDGLADYLYSYRQYSNGGGGIYATDRVCFYLNNGAGFDRKFRCAIDYEYGFGKNQKTYYGDCAK